MILTNKQQEGLKTAIERYKNKEPYTCISGYAGSGKSTLIKFIVAALGFAPEDVAYIAFTGKAANVLQQKGCPNAMTAHKLLYTAKQLPSGLYYFEEKRKLDEDYKLLVVDEVSMLPRPMWELLLRHHIYIIAAGDPGQLPPISETDNNHILDHPHVFLDEIMRQAKESEIIRLSMHVREGKSLGTFESSGAQVQIFDKSQITYGMYKWADQILCATNDKRNELNNIVRTLKGFGDLPCEEDKVISLNNHWDEASDKGIPLTNGSIGLIKAYTTQDLYLPRFICEKPLTILRANIDAGVDGEFTCIDIDYQGLLTGNKTLEGKQEFQMKKNKMLPNPPYHFVYGYAITTWKAQGSEWDKVLGFEENFPTGITHQQYLYTMITRARDKLVVIKK